MQYRFFTHNLKDKIYISAVREVLPLFIFNKGVCSKLMQYDLYMYSICDHVYKRFLKFLNISIVSYKCAAFFTDCTFLKRKREKKKEKKKEINKQNKTTRKILCVHKSTK